MTRFAEKSFSVGGHRPPQTECRHGWVDARGRCVLCGSAAALVKARNDAATEAGIRADLFDAPVPPLDEDYGSDTEDQYAAIVRAHYGGGRPFGSALHFSAELPSDD